MNCSLCSPCLPCGFMKCLKKENKKVSTSAPSMLESHVFHTLKYQDSLFGTCFLFAISQDLLQLHKMSHIVFLIATTPKDFREKMELTLKEG